jgi:hypothetical protein
MQHLCRSVAAGVKEFYCTILKSTIIYLPALEIILLIFISIATCYELDGPGIESRWGRNFQHLSRPALRPTQPPIQWVPGHSQE